MAAPTVYGASQARGRTGVTAAGLRPSRSRARSEPRLNPLREAKDGARNLMVPSQIRFRKGPPDGSRGGPGTTKFGAGRGHFQVGEELQGGGRPEDNL